MKGAPDISWLALASCFLLLLIPLAVTARLRLGLTRDLLVAVCRMTLQLILAGLYLGYLFKWNHPGMNLAWLAVMLVAASGSVLYNSALRWRTFIVPAFLALALATLGIVLYLNAFVVRLENLFEARSDPGRWRICPVRVDAKRKASYGQNIHRCCFDGRVDHER